MPSGPLREVGAEGLSVPTILPPPAPHHQSQRGYPQEPSPSLA